MILLTSVVGIIIGMIITWKILQKKYIKKNKELMRLSDKHLEMFLVMDKWFQKELKGKKFTAYLNENNFYNITIYGMGYIGKTLYEYLKKEGFEISNLIDQKNNNSVDGIRVRTIDEEHTTTDVVIVTAVYYFEELEESLKVKFKKPVLSFADIIFKI